MIRKYIDTDFQRLIELGNEYKKNFEKLYLNNNNNVFVYEEENNILGFIITEDTIDEVSIILIYVDKDYRNQKIATKLIKNLIDNLDEDINRIILEVSSNNIPAINLYNKMLFKKVGARSKYYSDGSDAIVMERKI